MTCSVRFNIQSEGPISHIPLSYTALKHCKKIKFSIYVNQTLMYTNCEQCYA